LRYLAVMEHGTRPAILAYAEAARTLSSCHDAEGFATKCPKRLALEFQKSMSRWESIARRSALLLSKYGDNTEMDPSSALAETEQFVAASLESVNQA
jgi:hypothetical protein